MKNIIISIVILLFVGCDEAEATSKENITNKVINTSIIKPVTEPIVLFLDDMTFAKAFAIEHRAKGEGQTFWWNGNQYTTDLAVLDEFTTLLVIFFLLVSSASPQHTSISIAIDIIIFFIIYSLFYLLVVYIILKRTSNNLRSSSFP